MLTPTPRLGLARPEDPDEVQVNQLTNNFTILDTAPAIAVICTSATKPPTPYVGLLIFETDTGVTRVWNGSSWVATAPPSGQGVSGDVHSGTAHYTTQPSHGRAHYGAGIDVATITWRPVDSGQSLYTIGSITFAPNQFTLNLAGLWHINGMVYWTQKTDVAIASIAQAVIRLNAGGSEVGGSYISQSYAHVNAHLFRIGLMMSADIRVGAGSTVQMFSWQNSGSTQTIDGPSSYLNCHWIAP